MTSQRGPKYCGTCGSILSTDRTCEACQGHFKWKDDERTSMKLVETLQQLIGCDGRITRGGFLVRVAPTFVLYILGVTALRSDVTDSTPLFIATLLLTIAAFLVYFSALIRRLHDCGWGGRLFLGSFGLAFIPVVNLVILAILFVRPGLKSNNEYGSPPVGLSVAR